MRVVRKCNEILAIDVARGFVIVQPSEGSTCSARVIIT
jgi:hypothetical protein